ncbi:hypothetical protein [Streptomyces lonarensis]|uniref:Uncharacterized protein n=1 Tax=Streptomyces lonarensis TaxID=700599 RepID=A0A7X6D419_9ACTN|nr:hypothetical protein [Streptomyces lonarensis]NJQ07803.1 hypothetical protein [Streptomyces lonarensis]
MEETERHSGARPIRARHVGFAVLALIVLAGMWGCARIVDGPPVPRADVRETTGRMQNALQTAHDAARGETSDGVAPGDGDAAADGADRGGAPAGAGVDAGVGDSVGTGDGGDDAQQEPETARLRVSPCYQTGMRAMSKQLEPGVYQLEATWSLPVAADDWAAVVRRMAEALEGEGWRQPQDGFRQEEHYVHLRNGDDEVSVTAREHTRDPEPDPEFDSESNQESNQEFEPDGAAPGGSEDGTSAGGGSSAGSDAASGGAQWFVSVEVRTDCARQDTPARTALPLLAAPTPEEVTWTETRW